jgi:hypothetical protein
LPDTKPISKPRFAFNRGTHVEIMIDTDVRHPGQRAIDFPAAFHLGRFQARFLNTATGFNIHFVLQMTLGFFVLPGPGICRMAMIQRFRPDQPTG